MNTQIVNIPDANSIAVGGRKADPEVVELGAKVAALQDGKAIKLKVHSSYHARVLQRKVRHEVNKLGFRMESRTDGIGHMYLYKGEVRNAS